MNRTFSLVLCTALIVGLAPSPALARGSNESFRLDGQLVLNSYEAMVEQHLVGVLNGLKALAATEEAMSGNWNRLKPPLKQFSRSVTTNAAIWFARPDGSYFTVEKGLTNQNIKDRDYFSELMQGRDVNGVLVVSRSTGKRVTVIATPIVKGGKVTGVLGASISATKLAKLVDDEINPPDDVIFYALDTHGLTALHKETSLIFQFPSDIGDQSLKSAVQKMLSEPKGTVHYTFRGMDRVVVFKRSNITGWVFALGITHTL
ncbi:MAG: cache domain-containing protein [Gammaproteobacteria bacterium]|jgi:hypothetical protein